MFDAETSSGLIGNYFGEIEDKREREKPQYTVLDNTTEPQNSNIVEA